LISHGLAHTPQPNPPLHHHHHHHLACWLGWVGGLPRGRGVGSVARPPPPRPRASRDRATPRVRSGSASV
jgi:hypothetical protein